MATHEFFQIADELLTGTTQRQQQAITNDDEQPCIEVKYKMLQYSRYASKRQIHIFVWKVTISHDIRHLEPLGVPGKGGIKALEAHLVGSIAL